jgi:hypothetical protein
MILRISGFCGRGHRGLHRFNFKLCAIECYSGSPRSGDRQDVELLCSRYCVDLPIVAITHIVRIIHGWSVAIGPHKIPMSISWAGLVVSALLALWGVGQAINNIGEIPLDSERGD